MCKYFWIIFLGIFSLCGCRSKDQLLRWLPYDTPLTDFQAPIYYELLADTSILIDFKDILEAESEDTLSVSLELTSQFSDEPIKHFQQVWHSPSASAAQNTVAFSLKALSSHGVIKLYIKGKHEAQKSIFIHEEKLRNLSDYSGIVFSHYYCNHTSGEYRLYSLDTIFADLPYSKEKTVDSFFSLLPDTVLPSAFLSKQVRAETVNAQSYIYNINDDKFFPEIATYSKLYQATAYLNPNYKRFLSDSAARIEFEKFWLSAGKKSFSNSRELIRVYYNRIRLANEYFTSYKEGWKTDRGMIYTIMGLPDMIDTELTLEKWVYFNDGGDDLELFFDRVIVSPVDNDFRLRRSSNYEFVWKNAVNNWNRGNIFSLFDE